MSIGYYQIHKASKVIRSVNHKLRQQLISLISEKKEVTVTDLYIALKREQSETSQHLSILRKSNVVTTRREGKFIYYSVNEKRLKQIELLSVELNKQ
mgnify:CR=1 FL=1